MPAKIFLIRHGVTECNKRRRYCGCRDVPLSRQGRLQAERLGERLRHTAFDDIYSSDRKRALETARIAFGGRRIKRLKGLREINFGIFEGLTHRQILKKYPEVYTRWLADPFGCRIPRGERLADFGARVVAAVECIASCHHGEYVAVVCHGGAISMVVSALRKRKDFWGYIPDSTGVTVLEYKNGKGKLKLFNCTKHLEFRGHNT